jgi:hypothetical protein
MNIAAAAEVFRTLLYTSHVRATRAAAVALRAHRGRRQAAGERAAFARHALTRRIAHAGQDGFGVIGPIGNTIYMSPSMRFLTGFDGREMAGCARRGV